MKPVIFAANLLFLSLLMAAPVAKAGNIADCEIILMETIEDENGHGGAQVASYRPAANFIGSIYDDTQENITELDGLPIRALLCRRNNVIISESDFNLLASGIPFILSQNFDSSESDLLTYFFKDGEFQYTHKGRDLLGGDLAILKGRMAEFNSHKDVISDLVTARELARNTAIKPQPTDLSQGSSNTKTQRDETHLDEEDSENNGVEDEVEIVKLEIDNPHVTGSISPETRQPEILQDEASENQNENNE